MKSALNFSIPDSSLPEFDIQNHNSFTEPAADSTSSEFELDETDHNNLMDMLENVILPLYYDSPDKWLAMVKNSMTEIIPAFDSGRMADEYYKNIYNAEL